MEFIFLNALGKKVTINVVRTFYGSDQTIEPINLIMLLKGKAQPIPYNVVAGLALEIYLQAKRGYESVINSSENGDLYKGQSLTSFNHDLAAYYQLLNKIGLPENEIKANPEKRIKALLNDLNIECKGFTPMIFGYDFTLNIPGSTIDPFREDMATIEKLFSTLLKYGITVDKAQQFSLEFRITINKGSPGLGKDKIIIDPKDKFLVDQKNEFKKSASIGSVLQSLSLSFPSEEELAEKKQTLNKNFLADVFKQVFSCSNHLKTLSNQIDIRDLFSHTDVAFAKREPSLNQAQQEEVLDIFKKLGINRSLISFEAPTKMGIGSGPCISIDLKKAEIEKIILGYKVSELVKFYKLKDASQLQLERGLRNAAANIRKDDLEWFIAAGTNVNAQDTNPKSKKTALHWAAGKNSLECVELLLSKGAKNSITDFEEKKPSDYKITPKILSLLNSNVRTSEDKYKLLNVSFEFKPINSDFVGSNRFRLNSSLGSEESYKFFNEEMKKQNPEAYEDLRSIYINLSGLDNVDYRIVKEQYTRTVKARYRRDISVKEDVCRVTITASNYGISYIEYRHTPEMHYGDVFSMEDSGATSTPATHEWRIKFNNEEMAQKFISEIAYWDSESTTLFRIYPSSIREKIAEEYKYHSNKPSSGVFSQTRNLNTEVNNLFRYYHASIEGELNKLVKAGACPPSVIEQLKKQLEREYPTNFSGHSSSSLGSNLGGK